MYSVCTNNCCDTDRHNQTKRERDINKDTNTDRYKYKHGHGHKIKKWNKTKIETEVGNVGPNKRRQRYRQTKKDKNKTKQNTGTETDLETSISWSLLTGTIYTISFETTVTGAVEWTRSVVALSICRAVVCVFFALVDICLLNWIRWKSSTWNVFGFTQTQTSSSCDRPHKKRQTQHLQFKWLLLNLDSADLSFLYWHCE